MKKDSRLGYFTSIGLLIICCTGDLRAENGELFARPSVNQYFDASVIESSIDAWEPNKLVAVIAKTGWRESPFSASIFHEKIAPRWKKAFGLTSDFVSEGAVSLIIGINYSDRDADLLKISKETSIRHQGILTSSWPSVPKIRLIEIGGVGGEETTAFVLITQHARDKNDRRCEVVQLEKYTFVPVSDNKSHEWKMTDQSKDIYRD